MGQDGRKRATSEGCFVAPACSGCRLECLMANCRGGEDGVRIVAVDLQDMAALPGVVRCAVALLPRGSIVDLLLC